MADNYLENKYAEYQARKTSGTRTGHTTKTLHKTRRVFITGGAEGIGKAIVRAFRGAGHRVAFCDKNETLGKETALQTGTQFHLVDVSDKTALEDCLRKIIEEILISLSTTQVSVSSLPSRKQAYRISTRYYP